MDNNSHEADAARWKFCVEHGVFPVRDQGGEQWMMFVAVASSRRSLFVGDSPAEAVDSAIGAHYTITPAGRSYLAGEGK